MKIERLELTHFGRFHHKTVVFTSGLNVVYGRNEAGKTTIHTFIRAMLFGLSDTGETADIYRRYLPWDTPDAYCGRLWLTRGGVCYRIERSFLAGNRRLKLFDETNGIELVPASKKLGELLAGLTQAGYLNMICIGQMKGADAPALARELEDMMIQTSQSKNLGIDVREARQNLINRRNELKKTMVSGADRESSECYQQLSDARIRLSRLQQAKSVQEELSRRYAERVETESGDNDERLMEYERERDGLRRRYEAARNAYDELPRVKDKDMRSMGMSWLIFLFVAVFLAGGAVALYLLRGLQTQAELLLIIGMCCLSFVFVALSFLSVITGRRRKERAQKAKELEKKLEYNYRKSFKAFEDCRQRAPKDRAELIEELGKKKSRAEAEAVKLEKKLKQEEEREKALQIRYDELMARSRSNEEVRTELEAVAMAYRTLNRLSERIHDTFGHRLSAEASKLLAKVTGGKYERVFIDQDMRVYLTCDEQEVSLESVSRGTIEQVYLCVRVAAADLLWQNEKMPFIFDDVFAYYDDERLEAAMRMLKECGHQSIIFSCHTRENQ